MGVSAVTPDELARTVLEGCIYDRLGTYPLSSLPPHQIVEAEHHFCNVVWADNELRARGIRDFGSLDALVTEQAGQDAPVALAANTRRALVVLAQVYMYMHERKGPLPSSLKKHTVPHQDPFIALRLNGDEDSRAAFRGQMAELKEYNKWGRLAENCILNAAYRCHDPIVLIAAGRYYLELGNAELHTAVGYFIQASEEDRSRLDDCDRLLKDFMKQRGASYMWGPSLSYLNTWIQHKQRIADS